MLKWFQRSPHRFKTPPVSSELERVVGSRPDEDPVLKEIFGAMYAHLETWNSLAIASPRPGATIAEAREFNAGGANAILQLIESIEGARASFRAKQKKILRAA